MKLLFGVVALAVAQGVNGQGNSANTPAANAPGQNCGGNSESFGGMIRWEFYEDYYPTESDQVPDIDEASFQTMLSDSEAFFLAAAQQYQETTLGVVPSNVDCLTMTVDDMRSQDDGGDCIFPWSFDEDGTPRDSQGNYFPTFWCEVNFTIGYTTGNVPDEEKLEYLDVIKTTVPQSHSIAQWITLVMHSYNWQQETWPWVYLVEMCPDITCAPSRSGETVTNSEGVTAGPPNLEASTPNATATSDAEAPETTEETPAAEDTATEEAPAEEAPADAESSAPTFLLSSMSAVALMVAAWVF